MSEVNVQGLQELLRAMKDLPPEIGGKVLQGIVLKQAQFIRKIAKENLRNKTGFWTTGLTERAIRVFKDKKNTNNERAIYRVGVSMNVKGPRKYKYKTEGGSRVKAWTIPKGERVVENVMWPPFWWRFIEFGTHKMAAKPFLRPAFDNNVQEMLSGMTSDLAKAIEKAAGRLAR
jgi:HK97 gp10 family phage protein